MRLSEKQREQALKFACQCDECGKFFFRGDLILTTIENKRGGTGDFLLCRRCYSKFQRKIQGEIATQYSITNEEVKVVTRIFNQTITNSIVSGKFKAHVIDLDYVFNLWKKQNGICALTGFRMRLDQSGKGGLYQPSLDRIDSNHGYIADNVQFVCWGANLMKQDLTMPEFLRFCSGVAQHRKAA